MPLTRYWEREEGEIEKITQEKEKKHEEQTKSLKKMGGCMGRGNKA